MKKLLTSMAAVLAISGMASAEIISIQGTDYQADVLIDRDLGPGINYKRLRIEDFPLNVNMVIMDLNNPYNRVETTQGGEQLGKTERLADAYVRQYSEEKRPLAGANGNFWCVSSQYPWADFLVGATFNGNVRNGQIITETNAHTDWWGHNNGSPGCVAITPDKKMYIDFMYYKGWVSNDKIGSLVIHQTNKLVRDNEIGLYNSFFGREKSFIPADQYADESGTQRLRRADNVSTEIYLKINEGNTWMVGRPMTCTVQEIKTDAGNGTLGDYDLCLVARGGSKTSLAPLAVGDEVTIKLEWQQPNGFAPEIEQLIGGNGVVMVDGVLTDLNHIDDYNSKTYSRTAYGTTADRKTLVNVVIDMSNDPVYGRSAGCNTLVMCDIMKHYGCVNIMNMDAGGSAQMMVEGQVVNRTTEGTPRAVANGWFFYSIAPKDSTIARLAFNDVELKAAAYSTMTPHLLGYNQYGDLVDRDVKGFTLSCDASIGTCDGAYYTACGTAATGVLTATLNGVSVSKEITVLDAQPKLRVNPLLIDNARRYAVEVTATIDGNIYTYNPASLEWKVEDESIVTIDENGIMQGLKEGSTTFSGTINGLSDTATVNVEIANAPRMSPTDFKDWKGSAVSGITKTTLAEDGTLSFTYGSPRGTSAYVQIAKDVTYYSLPDKLWLKFTSTAPLASMIVDLRSPLNDRANKVEVFPTEGTAFAANQTHEVEIPISALGDPADMSLYPLSLHYIQFYVDKPSMKKGDYTIKIEELSAEYDNYESGVENVIADKAVAVLLYPNPVTEGYFNVASSVEVSTVDVYSLSGAKVLSKVVASNKSVIDTSALAPGVYVVSVSTENGVSNQKLTIK